MVVNVLLAQAELSSSRGLLRFSSIALLLAHTVHMVSVCCLLHLMHFLH